MGRPERSRQQHYHNSKNNKHSTMVGVLYYYRCVVFSGLFCSFCLVIFASWSWPTFYLGFRCYSTIFFRCFASHLGSPLDTIYHLLLSSTHPAVAGKTLNFFFFVCCRGERRRLLQDKIMENPPTSSRRLRTEYRKRMPLRRRASNVPISVRVLRVPGARGTRGPGNPALSKYRGSPRTNPGRTPEKLPRSRVPNLIPGGNPTAYCHCW